MGARIERWKHRLAFDRPGAFAWAMYDWANSAFYLAVITTFFPIYYRETLAGGALDEDLATQRLAETTRNALIAIAVLAPVMGAMADVRPVKKRLLALFVLLGVASTAGMFLLMPGQGSRGLLLFGLANVGAAGSLVLYDALLPHVADRRSMDRLSTSGYALGYVGSGFLLVLQVCWLRFPQWFGLPSGEGLTPEQSTLPLRLTFLTVAIWWLLFTLPLLLRVPEPPVHATADSRGSLAGAVSAAFRQLFATLRRLRSYPDACRMLLAFLIYNDGIQTLIRMSVIYALSQGIARETILPSVLVLQFIAVPCSILFGGLGTRFGAKPVILFGVAVYTVISGVAYFMAEGWHFVVLAVLVGTVQGGTQGLSRSLFGSLIPRHQSGEFFALFGVGEKFAGIFGPMIFALVIAATGTARTAILSVVAFFAVGALLLVSVDVVAGQRRAREVEREAERGEGSG